MILPGPTACACCGSTKLHKLGEDVTETLEVIPRQWKVVQHVREKFTCRDCEKISQPPAPFHVLSRGFAGPSLLAMIVFEKYGQHQPLNRQSERYGREGVDLSVSTLADQVGGCAVLLRSIHDLICEHVFAGQRVHGDETPVPVQASTSAAKADYGLTSAMIARLEASLRRLRCSSIRVIAPRRTSGRHLKSYTGILQADASGFNRLYASDRRPGPITEASCWSHGRRKFFVLADVTAKASGKLAAIAPLALEAVKRIDAIFDIEREINGCSVEERLAVRRAQVAPLVDDLKAWMMAERAKLSRHSDVAKAMHYMLKRWDAFAPFLTMDRSVSTNNAAERALRNCAGQKVMVVRRLRSRR